MNRYKFRALCDDISDFTFKYGSLVYDEHGNPRILTDVKNMLFTTCVKETEGQYIGLPDCKETDIYEGDIVLVCESMVGDMVIPEAYCEVVFADGMYVAVGPGEYDWYPMDKNTIAAYEMVVKGNIHLNKDLIKKK
jgi:uncharacterized phage protein (TIGR01671 family)